MKHWPLRNRLAVWTAFLLTVELVIFGVASSWVIYQEQLEAFREIKGQPYSPMVIRKEASELIVDLTRAYLTALPVAVLVAAFGVWWITRKALQPLQDWLMQLNKSMPKPSASAYLNARSTTKSAD